MINTFFSKNLNIGLCKCCTRQTSMRQIGNCELAYNTLGAAASLGLELLVKF